jgi:endonuclease/exonuclease/phosphatase family metal-dependent hydrolase
MSQAAQQGRFTLVSWNVHSGIGTDGRFDLARVAGVLEALSPDIAALQEVGDFRGRMEAEAHPEWLADRLGLHFAFGPNVVRGGRRYGNAVLTRLPIARSHNYDLSVADHEPRGALRTDLSLGQGRQLHLFCLHLGLGLGERRQQAALLLSADILRDAVRRDPTLVCGDFNHWWSSPVRGLVRRALNDAGTLLGRTVRTYPSRCPLLRLDRVYVDGGVLPLSLDSDRGLTARHASDHLPLVLRFEVREVGGPPQSPVLLHG